MESPSFLFVHPEKPHPLNMNTSEADYVSGSGSGMYEKACPLEEITTPEVALRSGALLVIFVLSLVGNSLVIRIIHRNRCMRKATHLLTINLAAADLLITLTKMPEAVKVELTFTTQWFSGVFGLIMCKLLPFCQIVSVSCSIFTLVVISFDKYVAIVYPLKNIMSKRRLRMALPLTWLAAAAAGSPQLFANNLEHDADGSVWCVEKWPPPFDPVRAPRDYTIVYLVVLYLSPLCVMAASYGRVFALIWRRKVPGNRTEASVRMRARSRQKAGKMFVIVIVCFALCWLPNHIAFFMAYFVPQYSPCGPPELVWFLAAFFSLANSAVNPFIYFLMNKTYRRELRKLLCRRGGPNSTSDVTINIRTRPVQYYEQEISHDAVSLELVDLRYRKASAIPPSGGCGVALLHFRTLPQNCHWTTEATA